MKKTFLFFAAALFYTNMNAQVQLSESFEGKVFPPDGWTTIDGYAGYGWKKGSKFQQNCAKIQEVTGTESWLITPQLRPIDGDRLIFQACVGDYASSGELHIEISVSNTDVTSFEVIETYYTSPKKGDADHQLWRTDWRTYEINLSQYVGSSIYIAFHQAGSTDGIYIDNVNMFKTYEHSIFTFSSNPEWGTTSGDTTASHLDEVEISAIPNYGYHFTQWSDGNTKNPRTFVLTQDTTFTAEFAKSIYTITKNAEHGTISGKSSAEYLDEVTLSVSSDYGYHFTQWSDGVTDNPRTIVLTQDTTFIVEFAKNTYAISTASSNPEWGATAGDTMALYLEEVEISATSNYGYHFVRWNDNNRSNPRTVSVTEDKTYTATFAKNVYSITKNAEHGSISGNSSAEYLDEVTLSVSSDYGYHFAQWSDGNTDNPRTIVLTKDTTFTAEFAKNTYTISTTSANPEWGITAGDTAALYMGEVEISATANHGYHFVRWNDYNTSNPRTISVTEDKTYTATFAQNIYYITKYAENGYISGNSSAGYLENVVLTAIPNYGYHFVRWNDGVTENPRTFVITQDTTFTAEFVIDRIGACGDNNALTWSYDPAEKALTITGSGALSSNYTYGAEAPNNMEKLIITEGVTAIGANAFGNMSTLVTLQLPASLKTIGDKAFENCIDLTYIYNYRERPCLVSTTAFDGVNKFDCTLYVLAGSVDMYKSAGSNWKDFYYILPIGTAEVTEPVTDVITEPTESTVFLTWPTNDNAASYTIEITKDGVVFCTLIFNANGQLTGIAFAPSRDGSHHAPSALMTANGLQFTVTGLNSNTQYGYSVTAKDSNDQPVATYSGEFTTTGESVPTNIDEVQSDQVPCTKVVRDGQIFILRADKTYTLTGQEIK